MNCPNFIDAWTRDQRTHCKVRFSIEELQIGELGNTRKEFETLLHLTENSQQKFRTSSCALAQFKNMSMNHIKFRDMYLYCAQFLMRFVFRGMRGIMMRAEVIKFKFIK